MCGIEEHAHITMVTTMTQGCMIAKPLLVWYHKLLVVIVVTHIFIIFFNVSNSVRAGSNVSKDCVYRNEFY